MMKVRFSAPAVPAERQPMRSATATLASLRMDGSPRLEISPLRAVYGRRRLRRVNCKKWRRERGVEHDPEKACPGLDSGWIPVFGKGLSRTLIRDHAPR